MIKNILISEIIKVRKNVNFYLYFFIFFIFYTIFGFVFHLTRVGVTGNQNVPLNISYGSFIFYYGMAFSFFIFSLIFDFDLKDEINTNKIYFLLTGVIKRKDFYFGRALFYFIFLLIFFLILFVYSFLISSLPFPKLPILVDGNYIDNKLFIINLIFNFINLIPLIFFMSNIIFFTGYFFRLTSLTLIFYVLILFYLIFSPFNNIINIFYPFSRMIIHNNLYSNFYIFDKKLILYYIRVFVANIIIVIIILKNIYKREF